ncbi:MAG TPA: prohibitin family protein [Anaeromyxobacteraceae bacterium]|nr:prohibitin family protein [Anaeromyxobacteraceae bacterium]
MLFFLLIALAAVAFTASRAVRRTSAGAATGLVLAGVVLAALSLTQTFAMVPAGHVGVVDVFGSVSPGTLKAGINVVNPLARVVNMSVKTQEVKETMDVPSKEGLTMRLESSALFHLDPEKAADVYKTVGPEYVAVLLEPQFRSVTRGVTAGYEAKALYTSEREQLSELIAVDLRKLVGPRGIVIEAAPLRQLILPPRLAAAIEEKLGAEQESQRMQFVLQKERQEADRRRIEAQGIADFQKIVSLGINEQLLKWKAIEATLKIAESQNAKVVIIGSGKDGLPVILGSEAGATTVHR